MDADERMKMLDRELAVLRDRGFVMTEQLDAYAVDVRQMLPEPQPPNRVLHAILMVFTCFLWAIVWMLAELDYNRYARRYDRDPFVGVIYRVRVTENGEIETFEVES